MRIYLCDFIYCPYNYNAGHSWRFPSPISFQMFITVSPVTGVGLDMALSKGLELVQREDFEREVRRAVVATKEEYVRVLEAGVFQGLTWQGWCKIIRWDFCLKHWQGRYADIKWFDGIFETCWKHVETFQITNFQIQAFLIHVSGLPYDTGRPAAWALTRMRHNLAFKTIVFHSQHLLAHVFFRGRLQVPVDHMFVGLRLEHRSVQPLVVYFRPTMFIPMPPRQSTRTKSILEFWVMRMSLCL